jgi:outer membrane protein TolC
MPSRHARFLLGLCFAMPALALDQWISAGGKVSTIRFACALVALTLSAANISAASEQNVFVLSRSDAEREALKNSSQLKAFTENKNASYEQARAQYANLFPRLTFDAYYNYLSFVPDIEAAANAFQFGAHDNYAYGPTLSYTLWDYYSTRKAYYSLNKLTESRDRDRREGELQLLLVTRNEYVRVQELNEELRAVNDSLSLSKAQYRDISKRLARGGASRLEQVEGERAVLSYEIQFEQKQTELSAALRDLASRIQDQSITDFSRPGPSGVSNVKLVLQMDSLQKSLDEELHLEAVPPSDAHPRISARESLAESAELEAESIRATLWPTFKFVGRSTLQYPNGPVIEQKNQNSILVTASMPLFEMSQTRHRSEQKMREAAATRHEKDQVRTDLARDFGKAQDMLVSLLGQRKLAVQDVLNSSEAAKLYYQSYKGGKSQLIDVQTADNRALVSKVNKARIDAQILNQLNLLKALSDKGTP